MSPSIVQSAYSKTAIARGNCMYISYEDGANCEISNAVSNKEFLLYQGRGAKQLARLWESKEHLDKEKVWSSVKVTEEDVTQQCTNSKTAKDVILEYWKP